MLPEVPFTFPRNRVSLHSVSPDMSNLFTHLESPVRTQQSTAWGLLPTIGRNASLYTHRVQDPGDTIDNSGEGCLEMFASLDSVDGLLVLGISIGMEAEAWAGVASVAVLGPAEAWA